MKLPAGTYTIKSFFPSIGDGSTITGAVVAADATLASQNVTVAEPISITVNVTDGTSAITGAFVDVRDSSGKGNGTSNSTTSGANAVYTVKVPPGTYTVRVGHPAYGKIGETTSVSTTQTITYTAQGGTLSTVSGTVQANSAALSGAWVSIFGLPTGQTFPIHMGAQSGSDGTFSIQVPAGSYKLRADKTGYKSSADASVTANGATAAGTITLTTAARTISGTVTLDGTGISSAFVDATDGSGGFAVGQTDASGAYSLAVDTGTWTLTARSKGYQGTKQVVVTDANQTGQTIALTAISGFTLTPELQETITPSAGGLITNSNIGSGFKLNLPANALGDESNAATVTTQVNTAIPNPPSGTILSKSAVSISAVDSSGSPIKNLNDSVTITIPYTEADIPTGSTEGSLVIGVYNDSTGQYDVLSTTVDTTNNVLTATVDHFSDFAPLLPSSGSSSSDSGSSGSGSSSSAAGGGIIASAGGGSSTPAATPNTTTSVSSAQVTTTTSSTRTARGTALVSSGAGTTRMPVAVTFFTKAFTTGERSSVIKELQTLLNSDVDTRVASAGAGSPGLETDKLGPLTVAALKKFQVKHGIAKPGQAGFGTLGPKTRARLNDLMRARTGESSVSIAGPGSAPVVVASQVQLAKINALLEEIKKLQEELKKLQ
ncbi:MAG: hypothetical protein A2542_00760 [Parcubacteria group bacterium RIFOXYD2_FULL_52_8]|nr:MAG: hypothetical protein A2542_00760 [Parcubacteria group bacterium RIFOXYD2_FULL_52_8]